MARILLIEDDPNFGLILKDYLEIHGFDLTLGRDGREGWTRFIGGKYDLCLLDVMMPHKDGFSLAQDIRRAKPQMPIIFITARSMKEDVIKGFKLGADDYITKPFNSEELLYRIKAVLKRSKRDSNPIPNRFTLHNFTFDHALRALTHLEEVQKLSPREADLLQLLCLHKNQLLSREYALNTLWGDDNYFNGRSMDVFVTKLRKRFKADSGIRIENVHGKGYRFVVEGE